MNQGVQLNHDLQEAPSERACPPDSPLVMIVDDDAAVRTAIEELLFSVDIATASSKATP